MFILRTACCFALIFSLSGCKLILVRGFLGLNDQPNYMSDKAIIKSTKKRKIPMEQAFLLNNDGYFDEVRQRTHQKIETIEAEAVTEEYIDQDWIKRVKNKGKDDMQPVQLRFFKGSEAIYKSVNCYVNPFAFLNPFQAGWNVMNTLDEFPPKPILFSKKEVEKDDNLYFFMKHSTALNGNEFDWETMPLASYYAVVIWNDIAFKYSRKLIRQTKRYVRRHRDQNIHVFYINNHNAYIWMSLDEEQKEEITKTGEFTLDLMEEN